MIRRILTQLRHHGWLPMTMAEYREYRDREWCERIRQMEQEP